MLSRRAPLASLSHVIEITDLDLSDVALVDRLASVTFAAFREGSPEWLPTLDRARDQVCAAKESGRLGRVLKQDGQAMGWIGLIKGRRVWEIHPLAIATNAQGRGYGRRLVEDAAAIATSAGALTLYAGASDETGTTNLFGADLYADPAGSIQTLQASRPSAFRFWQSVGFTVVGLMPDAEGRGKPGIELARRL